MTNKTDAQKRHELMTRRDQALRSGDIATYQRLTTALAALPMRGVRPLTAKDAARYAKGRQ